MWTLLVPVVLLATLAASCSCQPITFDQAWVRHAAAGRSLGPNCQPDTPCAGAVGIFSHAYLTERRMRIRQTWLSPGVRTPPGLSFVFVLGLPNIDPLVWQEANRLVESHVRWEWETYHDLLILNVSEQDSHSSDAAKGHAWFTWAARHTQGSYQYYVKMDDDNVLNPYQLQLTMAMLPRREHVFWGRPLHKRGWPNGIHIGPLYFVSHDLADSLAAITHAEFVQRSELPVAHVLEDLRFSSFLNQLVPEAEWIDALPCQVHDHPSPDQPDELMYFYSNQSIVVHQAKEQYFFIEAFAALLPYIEAMASDCAEWLSAAQHEGHEGRAGASHAVGSAALSLPAQGRNLHLQPPAQHRCLRWLHNTSCHVQRGPFVPPDPDAKYRHVHRTALAMIVFMVAFSVFGIGGAIALEKYGGCTKLCR